MIKHMLKKHIKFQNIEGQSCPTYNDIIIASDISKKLKSNDLIEIISNVLEWEDKNIQYWYERADLVKLNSIGIVIYALIVFVAFSLNVLPISWTIIFTALLGTFIYFWLFSTQVYINLKNNHFISKKNIVEKNANRKLGKILNSCDMSVENMLKYKIAVCRDYTRLGCAILTSLNIDSYVVTYLGHAACAVKLNGIYYILDQSLPLKRIDTWLFVHKKKKADIYKLVVDERNHKTSLEYVQSYVRPTDYTIDIQKIDISYIKNTICSKYNVSSNSNAGEKIVIPIEKYDVVYYDEITSNSFVHLIIMKIDAELCGNTSNIGAVDVLQADHSIDVLLWVNQ